MNIKQVLSVDEIHLSDPQFWLRPWEEREGAFATLRAERPVSFQEEWDFGILPKGPGYWSLTRHADILEASRTPEVFCSGKGSNVGDLPQEFNEFFGSMINMDDPRHARLRRIVSRGFTPRMLQKVEQDVRATAKSIVGRSCMASWTASTSARERATSGDFGRCAAIRSSRYAARGSPSG